MSFDTLHIARSRAARIAAAACALAALGLEPGEARADGPGATIEAASAPEAQDDDDWRYPRVDLLLLTSLPTMLGAALQLELPRRIQARLDLGWMPAAYAELANGFAVGAGGYDRATAVVVGPALESALALRVSIGWRPFAAEGFEILAGYTMLSSAGAGSSTDQIEAATGADMGAPRASVETSLVLHGVHAWLAWSYEPVRHLIVRLAVGWLHTLGASTRFGGGDSARARIAERRLDDRIAGELFTPEIQISTGLRF